MFKQQMMSAVLKTFNQRFKDCEGGWHLIGNDLCVSVIKVIEYLAVGQLDKLYTCSVGSVPCL